MIIVVIILLFFFLYTLALIPVHTRALFDILQETYRSKSRDESIINPNNNRMNFMNLFTNNDKISTDTTSSIEFESTTSEVPLHETTNVENIIPAENIQLEKILFDLD